MSKTGWTMTTALVLVVLSVALGATRRAVLGPDFDSPRGTGTWRVTVHAAGELPKGVPSLDIRRPPDFRRQHIFREEQFESKELAARVIKRRQGRGRINWKRTADRRDVPQPFQLSYSFLCLTGTRRPTFTMEENTRQLDAEPETLRPAMPSRIKKKGDERLNDLADAAPEIRARRLFIFVAGMTNQDEGGKPKGALACLLDEAGDSASKSQLLVALCRGQGIPARIVTGIILDHPGEQRPHYWAEAWINKHWLPMCPTFDHFGDDAFPDTYLVLRTGGRDLTIHGDPNIRFTFQVEKQQGAADRAQEMTALKRFFLRISLNRLQPNEQHLIRFLLLLPLSALIVSVYRTLIGVPTFGTFSPALLGLAFLDMRALRWGLPIFLFIILIGWAMRHGLERFHLLQVPRASALLTLIVGLLIFLIVLSSTAGGVGTQYISLFPLVILTHLVERFWTIEAEDGTMSSFKTLLGTVFVAVTVSLTLSFEGVTTWMLSYPETLGVAFAAQLALGRYTGYRLSELYRFGDLIQDEPDAHGLAGSDAKPQAEKSKESTQC